MDHQVLVVDANALAMIATIRSLGRAGYKPHAAASAPDALGLSSRYAFRAVVHPDINSEEFVQWLHEYTSKNDIRAIVSSEEFLQAISDHYEPFEHLIPDSNTREVRERCLSKINVARFLERDTSDHRSQPDFGVIEDQQTLARLAARLTDDGVYYLKTDLQNRLAPDAKARVTRVVGGTQLVQSATAALQEFTSVLWQRHVSGLQVGVSLWRHDGVVHAENMVLGTHLFPHDAGNMSLRKSWWHEAILEDAKSKIAALGWNGVAMMEYIWNPETDEFWFVEINPRFWGYLHLDLSCGKDFPKWQLDAHFDGACKDLGAPKYPRSMRYVPGEIIHVGSLVMSRDVPLRKKLRSIFSFVAGSLNPRVGADWWFAGDRGLYFAGWIKFLRSIPRRLARISRHSGKQ